MLDGFLDEFVGDAAGRKVGAGAVDNEIVGLLLERDDLAAVVDDALDEVGAHGAALGDPELLAGEQVASDGRLAADVGDDEHWDRRTASGVLADRGTEACTARRETRARWVETRRVVAH